MKITEAGIILCFILVISTIFIWFERMSIAEQCERVGGFYVGDRDFVCSPKKKEPKQ